MARSREIPISLPSADDLFTTQEERDEAAREKVSELPLGAIDPFPDHPFRVRDDEEMNDLASSVAECGVLTPIVVRPKEDGRYELVSGHRRKRAAELAGLSEIPAIVRDMGEDEAVVAMVDANMQRERVLPSEKAFAYRMKLDAMKRQGRRTDLTSSPSGMKSPGRQTLEIIGSAAGDSRNTVHRYIRLTELLPELLDLVDECRMGIRPAVELSYLPKREQMALWYAIEAQACTPSHAQAIKMRSFSREGRLSEDVILSIICEEKPNQVEQFRMPKAKLGRFFKPGTSREAMEERIVRALELLERQERRRGCER